MLKNKILLFVAFSLVGLFLYSNDNDTRRGPILSFDNDRYELGRIHIDSMPEGNLFKLEIPFTNTGDEPIVITNIRACCGTRVNDYPREPVIVGEEGIIEVQFRLAPRVQRVNRTVTVDYNSLQRTSVVQRISGEVYEN